MNLRAREGEREEAERNNGPARSPEQAVVGARLLRPRRGSGGGRGGGCRAFSEGLGERCVRRPHAETASAAQRRRRVGPSRNTHGPAPGGGYAADAAPHSPSIGVLSAACPAPMGWEGSSPPRRLQTRGGGGGAHGRSGAGPGEARLGLRRIWRCGAEACTGRKEVGRGGRRRGITEVGGGAEEKVEEREIVVRFGWNPLLVLIRFPPLQSKTAMGFPFEPQKFAEFWSLLITMNKTHNHQDS